MNKIFTILIISLFIFSCGKDEPLPVKKKENIREEIIERYNDGSKRLVVKYKGTGSNEIVLEKLYYKQNGIRYNDVRYYEGGELLSLGQINNDNLQTGDFISFFKNGVIGSQGQFVNGERQGEWITYRSNGEIQGMGSYENGNKEGTWLIFVDGVVKYIYDYKDGQIVK